MTLPDMKVARLTAADVPAIIALSGSIETASAAAAAQAELRLLFTVMSPGDLIVQAACHASPRQWLTDLALAATTMRTAMLGARAEANQLMAADALERHRFDGATLRLLAQDEERRRTLLKEAANADVDKDLAQVRMREAGMTPDEISALLAQRRGDSTEQDLHDQVAAITQRIDSMTAFIRNPLRELEMLGADLVSEVRTLNAAMSTVSTHTAGSDAANEVATT